MPHIYLKTKKLSNNWSKLIYLDTANWLNVENTIICYNCELNVASSELPNIFDFFISNSVDMRPHYNIEKNTQYNYHIQSHDNDYKGGATGQFSDSLKNLLNEKELVSFKRVNVNLQTSGNIAALLKGSYFPGTVGIAIKNDIVGSKKGNVVVTFIKRPEVGAPSRTWPSRLSVNFHININPIYTLTDTLESIFDNISNFHDSWKKDSQRLQKISLDNFQQRPCSDFVKPLRYLSDETNEVFANWVAAKEAERQFEAKRQKIAQAASQVQSQSLDLSSIGLWGSPKPAAIFQPPASSSRLTQ